MKRYIKRLALQRQTVNDAIGKMCQCTALIYLRAIFFNTRIKLPITGNFS